MPPISLNPNKKITIMSDGFMVDSQPSEVSLLVKQNLNPIPPASLNSNSYQPSCLIVFGLFHCLLKSPCK